MSLSNEDGAFRYPWKAHIYMILPLTAMTLFTAFGFGWWGEGPYSLFRELRAVYPFLSVLFRLITSWENQLIYCVYIVLLIRAIYSGDTKTIWNIIWFSVLSLLFLGIVLQLLKYGLGMPRPGIP